MKKYYLTVMFFVFIICSYIFDLSYGKHIAENFRMFILEMIAFLPLMFILIGLIDVWFPKEKIQKHIDNSAGIKGTIYIILLATLQAGPLYGAFPVAYMLWKKGSSIRNIFIYLGAFSTLKIPMLTFETGFLGLKFTLLRTIITLPVFVIIALIMDKYLKEKNFKINSIEESLKNI